RIVINWEVMGAGGSEVTVESCIDRGAWEAIDNVSPDGRDRLRYEDRDVSPGARYGYRLSYQERGRQSFSPETWVDVPTALTLALEGLRPNPSHGDPTVVFTIP